MVKLKTTRILKNACMHLLQVTGQSLWRRHINRYQKNDILQNQPANFPPEARIAMGATMSLADTKLDVSNTWCANEIYQ
jgi:hypothetical protein